MAVEGKICGLTRAVDAEHAANAGAAYLGVVFARGVRQTGTGTAAEIVAAAGEVPVLGVFDVQSVGQILSIRDTTGIAGAQLHGAYGESDAERLAAEGMIVWRVARIAATPDLEDVAGLALHAHTVLVEPRVAHAAGGTGAALDLGLAAAARARLAGGRMALAGGLTAETVAAAVALVLPAVADVSSGVEAQPGIKDPARVSRFLEALIDPDAGP